MSTDILGYTFKAVITYGTGGADPKPTRYVDTCQAVKKPLYYPRFSTYIPSDIVSLAYASINPLDIDKNLSIIDRSRSMIENSPDIISKEDIFTGNSFSSFYKNLLITDVYTDVIPSKPTVPLFYVHLLDAGINHDSINILDSSFNRINTYDYKILDIEDPVGTAIHVGIYNDLHNSFNEQTGEVQVYYVQYVDLAGLIQTILLNNQQVYKEATFDDLNWTTLHLKSWVNAYIIGHKNNIYEFTLPSSQTYSIRYIETTNINTLYPVVSQTADPWFMRITNGAFSHTFNNIVYNYQISEFHDQLFNPIEPYKFIADEPGLKVTDSLIKVKHTPLALPTYPIDIIIANAGTTLYALTTNLNKVGTEYAKEGVATGIDWSQTEILSYDVQTGLIHLDVMLKDYYTIDVTYYYQEQAYEFSLLNLNPITNSDALEYFYVLYLVPNCSVISSSSQTVSLHYLKVNRGGKIEYCSQDGSNGEPPISVVGKSYGRPGSTDSTTFINNYTIEGVTTDAGYTTNKYLVLADISLVQTQSIEDLSIIDTRQRGGGIKESNDFDAKKANPEVMWYTDIGFGGGIPYPGKAVIITKLPCTLLKDYGGDFTDSEIREIVNKHLPFGHYPLIRYYGVVPDISLESVDSGSITISWPSEGSGYKYDVYYATIGEFTKDNATLIDDNISGNTYIIDSLTAGTIYRIKVKAYGTNIAGLPYCNWSGCTDTYDVVYGPDSIEIIATPLV